GLFVIGETSCTGLHGANRLASNSLTDCFVLGGRAGDAAVALPPAPRADDPPPPGELHRPEQSTREALWRYAGLVRDREGLERLREDPHPLARLVAICALAREESRGAHFRSDFPEQDRNFDHRHAVVGSDERVV